MHVTLSNIAKNEIDLELTDEDISIMYIIQYHLLKEKGVDFAGVVMKHPLIKEFQVKIISKNDPMKSLEKSVESASDYSRDISNLILESIQK